MIKRALRSYVFGIEADKEWQRERVLRWYNNLKKCSCHMCGNPRRYTNRKLPQEQRMHEAARYECAEAESGRGQAVSKGG